MAPTVETVGYDRASLRDGRPRQDGLSLGGISGGLYPSTGLCPRPPKRLPPFANSMAGEEATRRVS
jgi:hypothetical protein